MIAIVLILSLAAVFVRPASVSHEYGGGEELGGKATSYQTIHMEHFHAVPTYVKKEYKHLLEHPLPAGKSVSKVEIHHGGKHDHGYAHVDAHNTAHGSGYDDGGYHEHEGHGSSNHLVTEAKTSNAYQVHDQGQEAPQQFYGFQYQGAASDGGIEHYQAAAGSHQQVQVQGASNAEKDD